MHEQSRLISIDGSKTLIIAFHAFTANSERLNALKSYIEVLLPEAQVETPFLNMSLFSRRHPDNIAIEMVSFIDEIWNSSKSDNEDPPFNHIILMGHSTGGLIARKLYINACGFDFDKIDDTKEPKEWAIYVDRIILLASLNRGWAIGSHMEKLLRIKMALGIGIGKVLSLIPKLPKFLAFHTKKGSKFITNLRLKWILMDNNSSKSSIGNALVIQLLGSIDDIVSPEDNVDLETGKDFVYLDIPNSSHRNVIELDDPVFGPGRKKIIRKALLEQKSILRSESEIPADLIYLESYQKVTDVVFVIHGIRDEGFWTHKIARKVKKLGIQENRIFRTETSSYGYFPILSFLTPWVRRSKVAWLMEQYIKNRVLYPNADFSFIGHSNGTYLLANALNRFSLIKFKNVVFAGSVVNQKYKWSTKIQDNQVDLVLNFVASFDWVVAAFPFGLSKWKARELGGAGHVGFKDASSDYNVEEKRIVRNFSFVEGAHSAAIEEPVWEAIAQFIVNNKHPEKKDIDVFVDSQPTMSKLVGFISFIIIPLIVLLLIGLLAFLLIVGSCWPEWIKTLMVMAWAWLVWTIVTKF